MRAPLTLLAWIAMALPLAAQPAEDCASPSPPSPDLIRDLTRWIGTQTDYDITRTLEDPPKISFCRTGEIITYEGRNLLVDPALRAAYYLSARPIYLVLPWNADNASQTSALLHELIHDVQLTNRDWPCIGAPEWQAYKLQERWLLERGIAPEFDWMSIYMWSRCPRDVHPD